MPPLVSIVVPLYNAVEHTVRCLEHLVAHTADDAYEVVLVDNASADGTADLLASLDGDVTIVRNPTNLGFARACNQGAAAGRGDVVLFLNNDAEVQPGWLPPLLDRLDHTSVGAVGARLLFPDGTLQHAGMVVIEDRDHRLLDCRHRWVGEPADRPDALVPARLRAVTGALVAVRRTDFDRIGGFHEGYWNGVEDVDLCFALAAGGREIWYEPAATAVHHESASGPERWRRVRENVLLLARRWYGRVDADLVVERGVVRAA